MASHLSALINILTDYLSDHHHSDYLIEYKDQPDRDRQVRLHVGVRTGIVSLPPAKSNSRGIK